MTPRSAFKSRPVALPIGVLLIAMISIQGGAAFAKALFPRVGAPGMTALRIALASIMLIAVWRPWRLRPTAREARSIVIYGLAMGWMNFFFYLSLSRIPLGIAVALEFTGPLAVAMATSRRALDFAWIALAVFGLWALLPLGPGGKSPSSAGIAYALAAGLCWAIYILFGQRAGSRHAGQIAALGTAVGALVIVPIGAAQAGSALFAPAILPAACAVALLSSALPYSLEMFALPRLPTRTFGILMSLEPALAALSGLLLLGEHLTVIQWTAIGSIMLASGGSAATGRRDRPPPLPE